MWIVYASELIGYTHLSREDACPGASICRPPPHRCAQEAQILREFRRSRGARLTRWRGEINWRGSHPVKRRRPGGRDKPSPSAMTSDCDLKGRNSSPSGQGTSELSDVSGVLSSVNIHAQDCQSLLQEAVDSVCCEITKVRVHLRTSLLTPSEPAPLPCIEGGAPVAEETSGECSLAGWRAGGLDAGISNDSTSFVILLGAEVPPCTSFG